MLRNDTFICSSALLNEKIYKLTRIQAIKIVPFMVCLLSQFLIKCVATE